MVHAARSARQALAARGQDRRDHHRLRHLPDHRRRWPFPNRAPYHQPRHQTAQGFLLPRPRRARWSVLGRRAPGSHAAGSSARCMPGPYLYFLPPLRRASVLHHMQLHRFAGQLLQFGAEPVVLRTAMAERHAWPVSLDLNPDVIQVGPDAIVVIPAARGIRRFTASAIWSMRRSWTATISDPAATPAPSTPAISICSASSPATIFRYPCSLLDAHPLARP